jgi:hypothetical protein
MAEGLSAHMLGVGATAMAAEVSHLQVHSGDPGAAGTSNVVSGPARAAVTMSASGASFDLDSAAAFTGGGAGAAAGWVSMWDASTGGNWLGNAQITEGDTTFNAAGELNVTSIAVSGS